jgi:hypothetical protein
MVHAILRVTGTLRDAMLRDHICTDDYENKDGCTELSSSAAARDIPPSGSTQGNMAAATAGRFSAAGMETAASVGTTSRFVAHWVESTKTVVSHGLRELATSKPRVSFDDQDIRTGTVKAESLRKASGISDAANDGTCWIKSAKVTSTL